MRLFSQRDNATGSLITISDIDLILLGEPQVVVGFQQLDVLGQFVDGDRRMAHHSCSKVKKKKKLPVSEVSAETANIPAGSHT